MQQGWVPSRVWGAGRRRLSSVRTRHTPAAAVSSRACRSRRRLAAAAMRCRAAAGWRPHAPAAGWPLAARDAPPRAQQSAPARRRPRRTVGGMGQQPRHVSEPHAMEAGKGWCCPGGQWPRRRRRRDSNARAVRASRARARSHLHVGPPQRRSRPGRAWRAPGGPAEPPAGRQSPRRLHTELLLRRPEFLASNRVRWWFCVFQAQAAMRMYRPPARHSDRNRPQGAEPVQFLDT